MILALLAGLTSSSSVGSHTLTGQEAQPSLKANQGLTDQAADGLALEGDRERGIEPKQLCVESKMDRVGTLSKPLPAHVRRESTWVSH